jgi:hypothetical protein
MRIALFVFGLLCACQASPRIVSLPPPQAIVLPLRVTGANLVPVADTRRGYGTKTARATVERLKTLGVNTVSILLEGRMTDLSDRHVRLPSSAELEAIAGALRDANAQGLATILVPHLYLDDGAWRGRITHDDPVAREQWWESYRAFIGTAADLAEGTGTSLLAIGVELKSLSAQPDFAAKMFALAAETRRTYSGALTYAANWDEAEAVAFWGAVDFAGINGYYPLLPEPVRGAEAIGRRLTALASRTSKEVLVLEVGYRSSPLSHVKPWEWPREVHAVVDDASQANCWAAVLSSWLNLPAVRGLLVWVIPTDPDDPASEPRHGFNPLNKPAEEIIARAFRGNA